MSTTQSIFRPDERRAKMMVEHIPWNYKWDASEGALPNWLKEVGNNNGNIAEADRKWFFEDGALIHSTSDVNKIKFVGTMYTNGVIIEVLVNWDDFSTTSWAGGLRFGLAPDLHTGQFIALAKNPKAIRIGSTTVGGNGSGKRVLIPNVPSGYFPFRVGYDKNTGLYFAQVPGERAEIVLSGTTAWSFLSFQAQYSNGSSGTTLRIRSIKFYTY